MAISLKRGKLDEKPDVKDYGQGKRTPPKLRWMMVVLVISIPLIYLIYLLLDETVLADFQGVIVFDTVKIRAPDAGYVETLFVKEGQHVKRGQPLLQFNSPNVDQQLIYLKKEQARIQGQVDSINKKSTESLTKHLEILKKDILASQLVYDKFAKYYRQQGHIAAIELEQARKNVITAKEAYSQMQHQIKQVRLENDLMVEVNYKRKLEEVNHKITQAEIKKKYFAINSPAKGTIKNIHIHRGEFLPSGEDIIDIVTKNNLHVVVYVDPKSADELKLGAIVKLTFPDNYVMKGKVINVPNFADRQPLAFQNPLAQRENKLVAIVEFEKEPPKKYRVYGVPLEVNIE